MSALPTCLADSASFMLARLGVDARRRLADALAHEGLRFGDYAAIALLGQLESAPQQTLSRTLSIDRSSVVDIVDRLEACGAAERRPDPSDRRRYAVSLTGRGRAILARCTAVAEAVDGELLASLDEAERAALVRLLGQVAAACQSSTTFSGSDGGERLPDSSRALTT
jgi:MarR family transcriptional regulator, lower aerobic nicotinate degradation pathway regulator